MSHEMDMVKSVFITGAGGYLGRQVVSALARDPRSVQTIAATDIRQPSAGEQLPGVKYVTADIRSTELSSLLKEIEYLQ